MLRGGYLVWPRSSPPPHRSDRLVRQYLRPDGALGFDMRAKGLVQLHRKGEVVNKYRRRLSQVGFCKHVPVNKSWLMFKCFAPALQPGVHARTRC